MKEMKAATVIGLVVLGALGYACSSEVPIGEGVGHNSGALGAAGQPPNTDGTCDTRLTVCGTTCRDLGSDDANCGSCGNACAAGDSCASGVCTAPPIPVVDAGLDAAPATDAATDCPFGQSFCGGACIDVLFDSNNCGDCGVKCGAGTSCVRATCM